MSLPIQFIIIDDDIINNQIVELTLKKFADNPVISSYTFGQDALNLIKTPPQGGVSSNFTIIFLDINMPRMSGWDFLRKFEEIDKSIRTHIKIYILSSSIDLSDIEKAKTIKLVSGYLVKPLTREKIQTLLEETRQKIISA